jgi:hypothetical protein
MKKSEMLAVKVGEEIENINNITLEDNEKNKIEKIKEKLRRKAIKHT